MRRRKSAQLLRRTTTVVTLLSAIASGSFCQVHKGSSFGGSGHIYGILNAPERGKAAGPKPGGGKMNTNQKVEMNLDAECVSLSQPLLAITATSVQDDIFTQCSSLCSETGSGDIIIISTVGMQATCGCAFVNMIAPKVVLLDKSLCDMTCGGGQLNLPCGSTTVSTTASMYSIPSLTAFLSRFTNIVDQTDGKDDSKTSTKTRQRRLGIGPGAITAIVLTSVILVGAIIVALMKILKIKRDRNMEKYEASVLGTPYKKSDKFGSGDELALMSSSTVTKQNLSSDIINESGSRNAPEMADSQALPEVGDRADRQVRRKSGAAAITGGPGAGKEAGGGDKETKPGLYSEIRAMDFFNDSLADAIMKEGKLHEPNERGERKNVISLSRSQGSDIDDAGIRAERINRNLRNTTLSRPALVAKKPKSSTVPRKEPLKNAEHTFHTADRPTSSHRKKKSSRSKRSYEKKDSNKVKIREDFVVPRRNTRDEDTFSPEYLDAYKRKLYSERRAFDAAHGADEGSSDEIRAKKPQKPAPTPAQQLTNAYNLDNIGSSQMSGSEFRFNEYIPEIAQSTLHKDEAVDSSGKLRSSSSLDESSKSPSGPREPSINFQTPTEAHNANPVTPLNSLHLKIDRHPVGDHSKYYNGGDDIPVNKDANASSRSPGVKSPVDYRKYNNVVTTKKQPPIDKRTTYLSMKLKSIQLNPSGYEADGGGDHHPPEEGKGNNDNDYAHINDSFIDEYRLPPSKDRAPGDVDNGSTEGGDSYGIDKIEALHDMGLVGDTDFRTATRKEIEDLDKKASHHIAGGPGLLSNVKTSKYSPSANMDSTSTSRRSSGGKRGSKQGSKTKRISAAFSRVSENFARRSNNIRDSLIKRFNEHTVSAHSKSDSVDGLRQESQNDDFVPSESDSKQNN